VFQAFLHFLAELDYNFFLSKDAITNRAASEKLRNFFLRIFSAIRFYKRAY